MPTTGLLIIISSPSGGGKDAVISALLKIFPHSAKLVTTTDRSMRQEDVDGQSYHFTTTEIFKEKIKSNEIIEHNFYSGHYYGIEKKELTDKLNNFDLIFTNIDINGRRTLSNAGYKNLSIFLLPDDLNELKKRIARRGNINEIELEKRLTAAQVEIKAASEYDFQVINKTGQLTKTINNVAKIIEKYQRK